MKRTLIILTAFVIFFVLWYFNLLTGPFYKVAWHSQAALYTLNYLLSGLVPAAALLLLHKPCEIVSSMGLAQGFGTGLLFAVIATLPMMAGYVCIGTINHELSVDQAITWIFIAGFFEEVIFRGFVFGQLFRYARWGFVPAALITALAFGSLHLYQGHDLASALGSFAITALGSIFFSWIYVEWNYNLWTAIWLHTLMNLPWIVLRVSENGAVGDIGANILRISTIGLAIGLTVVYKKRKGVPYFISSKNMFKN